MGAGGRRPIVAGNWKMNKTIAEAVALVRESVPLLAPHKGIDLVVAPPFTAIRSVVEAVSASNIQVAAQNCHWEAAGAFTGEVSAAMLREAGCKYVILGHSERRLLFGETDEGVNRKISAVLKERLTPIVCIGETLKEREAGKTLSVVTHQLEGAVRGLSAEAAATIVLAYEPVWAIGTGKNATSAQAQEVHAHIRRELSRLLGARVAAQVRIQYGGSVKPDNAKDLLGQPDVDGSVGGASLKAPDFAEIVRATSL